MSKSNRDEFSESTKVILALRVSYRCSNPDCDRPTTGPHSIPTRAIRIGVASHISGAAPGSARYDSLMVPEQRKNISNGIWLCQSCSRLIDTDEQKYPVELLLHWKSGAENKALVNVENPPLTTRSNLTNVLGRIEELATREFNSIDARLGQIENLVSGFPTPSGSAEQKPTQEGDNDILGYVVLGLNDKEFITWFELFGDDPDTISTEGYQDVYFRDFRELQGTIKAVNSVLKKADALTHQGIHRDKAYEKALFEVGISLTRMYIAKRLGPKRKRPPLKVPGLKYVIYGVKKDRAKEIEVLRTKQLIEGSTEPKRDAYEIYFKNPLSPTKVPEIIRQAVERSNGDKEAFIGWMFEGIMRLKTFGPDVEVFSDLEFDEDNF